VGRRAHPALDDRAVKRGKLSTEDQQALFDRVTFATSLEALAHCDLVIEARDRAPST